MERWRGRVAVVTGASAGIGAAIAYQLQDAGLTVIGLARRSEKIRSAVEEARREAQSRGRASLGKAPSPGTLHALNCDVSKEEDILAAFKWVKDNLGGVDILVNNAGAGGNGDLENITNAEVKNIFDINVLGLSICSREAIKLMKATGVDDGHIIHIGSINADRYMHLQAIAMYMASKTAVRVLTEGLRKELAAAKSKIRVTEVRPGYVNTETFINDVPDDKGIAMGQPFLHPEDLADAVLYVIATPDHVQIHNIIVRPVGDGF